MRLAAIISIAGMAACGSDSGPAASPQRTCPYEVDQAAVQAAINRAEAGEVTVDATVKVATSQESDGVGSVQPALTMNGSRDAAPESMERAAHAAAGTITGFPVPDGRTLVSTDADAAKENHWYGLTFRVVSREGADPVVEMTQECKLLGSDGG